MKIQTNPHTLNMIDPERDLAFRPNAASNSWFVIGLHAIYLARALMGRRFKILGYPGAGWTSILTTVTR
jgi:hypothetical protein